MKECPYCQAEYVCLDSDEVEVMGIGTFTALSKARRIPIICRNCCQPLWFFPRTGRITKRKERGEHGEEKVLVE